MMMMMGLLIVVALISMLRARSHIVSIYISTRYRRNPLREERVADHLVDVPGHVVGEPLRGLVVLIFVAVDRQVLERAVELRLDGRLVLGLHTLHLRVRSRER